MLNKNDERVMMNEAELHKIQKEARDQEVERQLGITKVLAGIEKTWRGLSFLRFGQMMQGCFGDTDIFYLSNHKLVQQLTDFPARTRRKI